VRIVFAGGSVRLLLGPRQRRQQQAGENGNDGNHHQQLNQRECNSTAFFQEEKTHRV